MIGAGASFGEALGAQTCRLVGGRAVLATGGWAYQSSVDIPLVLIAVLAVALVVLIVWPMLARWSPRVGLSPQARIDARLGTVHSCGDGRKEPWQYVGPLENLTNWEELVWRRFRVCPACGECQFWPVTSPEPGDTTNWTKWRPILFDDMMTRIKIRDEHVTSMKKQEDAKRRVMEEKRIQQERAAAEAATKRQESNEKAREFVNAKIQLLNKPDEEESKKPVLGKSR